MLPLVITDKSKGQSRGFISNKCLKFRKSFFSVTGESRYTQKPWAMIHLSNEVNNYCPLLRQDFTCFKMPGEVKLSKERESEKLVIFV